MAIHLLALNLQLDADQAPEWIELIPAGPMVRGVDGRAWRHESADDLIAAFNLAGRELVLDWEHSSEHRARAGQEAPAAGWITELEARQADGVAANSAAIWGRVRWTPRAAQQIADREYRFISPVFYFEKSSSRITRLKSAGLTNQPNLDLTALNREQGDPAQPPHEDNTMPIPVSVLHALSLAEGASESAALNAIQAMKDKETAALNRAENPSAEHFVPAATHQLAVNRAEAAEQKLADIEQTAQNSRIEAAVDAAVQAGKVAPANKDFYVASCKAEGGLAAFENFVKSAPVIAAPSGLDGKKPVGEQTALNTEEAQVAAMFGNSAEDIAKTKQEG